MFLLVWHGVEGRKEGRKWGGFVGEGGRGYTIINVKDGIGWDFCHLIGGVSVIVKGAVWKTANDFHLLGMFQFGPFLLFLFIFIAQQMDEFEKLVT